MNGRHSTGVLSFLDDELKTLAAASRLREPRLVPEGAVVLCSNDYLGYGREQLLSGGAASGSGASPLVVGYRVEHAEAETALADWLGTEAALLFSSGYAANVGAIAALVGTGDLVVSDALNHASIIDGCRLSGARVVVVPHLDHDAIDTTLQLHRDFRRRLVVSESYFSMDADGPDLERLSFICSKHGAILMLDEAHALGIYGQQGRGRAAEAGVIPDVLVGTLGKSLGLQGAFVAGSAALRLFLWNRARSLVFSTALSPVLAGAVSSRVQRLRVDSAGRGYVLSAAEWVRRALRAEGWDVRGHGPIVPVVVGADVEASRISERLRHHGLILQAIRPPTVPVGSARLRMTVTRFTSRHQLSALVAELAAARA